MVSSFNELVPGHVHLQPLCQAIKLGSAEVGATQLEFPSIAICKTASVTLSSERTRPFQVAFYLDALLSYGLA